MRPRNNSAVQYAPGDPPADPAQLQRFLREELQQIRTAIEALAAGHLDQISKEPAKPRDGDLRYASGAPGWDPGAGKGIYMFSTAWTLVKAIP